CASGFTGTGLVCTDIDECATNNGGCASVAAGGVCTNTAGSRTCACAPGYAGNGFTCSPNGDLCSGALPIALSATVNGSTVGATDSFGAALSAACNASSVAGPDVVYAFTPASTGTYLVNGVMTSGTGRFWTSASCGVAASCTQASEIISTSFVVRATAGQPTFIHADSDTGGGGPFTLQVTSVTPPTNDTCAAATVMTAGTPVTGSLVNAVNDFWPNAPCSQTNRRRGEVVLSFTPSTTGQYVFRETSTSDVVMWLANACDNSCTTAVDDPEILTATLTAGVPVYFFVEPYASATTYTVRVDPLVVPPNDTCASPTVLTSGVTVNGTTVGANNDFTGTLSMVCAPYQVPAVDVVYSFTAPSAGNYRVTTTTAGLGYSPRIWAALTCGVPSACFDGDSQQVLPFTMRSAAGTTTYLHVDGINATTVGDFTIGVAPVATPANDVCATPTPMTLNVPVTGDFLGAVDDLLPTSCAAISTFSNGDLVYTFTPATSGNYRFRESTATNVVFWISTACDGTCIGSSSTVDDVTVALTGGVTYYVILEPFASNGTFSFMVTPG
ncbi:MAG: hypothetical protein GQE15_17120, partial [Archangiaceae bacterium]|nr:hypothetical protein [Archangiaceae bacterium]